MKLAVIGDPVAHSRSPGIVRALLGAAGCAGSYEALQVRAGEGAAAIVSLRARGYLGLNVTTPLKEEAFARAEWRDAAATASGSVNTLVLETTIAGYDTDGIGALGVLKDAGLRDVTGRRILVLGAGPTARSVAAALRAAGAAVWLWSRTPARAREAIGRCRAEPFASDVAYDAVFAALPPDAAPDAADVRTAVLAAPLLVDANYGPRATLGHALGRTATDGSRMLEHSARASFEIWRHVARKAAVS